jgi:hypothetical protein
MTAPITVSELDNRIHVVIRSNVVSFMKHCSTHYAKIAWFLLDIALFPNYIAIKTLDINSKTKKRS